MVNNMEKDDKLMMIIEFMMEILNLAKKMDME